MDQSKPSFWGERQSTKERNRELVGQLELHWTAQQATAPVQPLWPCGRRDFHKEAVVAAENGTASIGRFEAILKKLAVVLLSFLDSQRPHLVFAT